MSTGPTRDSEAPIGRTRQFEGARTRPGPVISHRGWFNPFARLAGRSSGRIEQIDRFDSQHDIVGDLIPIDRPFPSRRSDDLNWRYSDHPNTTYVSFVHQNPDCRGICVVRRARVMGRDLALVMEVFGTTTGVQVDLLSHAADWAHRSGLGLLALMDTSPPLATALRTMLFPVPSFLLPKRQVLVVHGEGELPRSLTKRKWTLQTGDWDVF